MSKRPQPKRRNGVHVPPPINVGDQFSTAGGRHKVYAVRGRGRNRAALVASFEEGKRNVSWRAIRELRYFLELNRGERFEGAICRVCGCTDDDCQHCLERTGSPCRWIEPDLCSACHGLIDLAFQGGVDAAERGDQPGSNPHTLHPLADNDLWAAWRKGWIERKNEKAMNSLKAFTGAARRAGLIQ